MAGKLEIMHESRSGITQQIDLDANIDHQIITFEDFVKWFAQAKKIGVNKLDKDTPVGKLGIDSLGLMHLLFELEEKLHVQLSVDQINLSSTLENIFRLIVDAKPSCSSSYERNSSHIIFCYLRFSKVSSKKHS